MAVSRTIYRQLLRHSVLIFFLCAALLMGFSLIQFLSDDTSRPDLFSLGNPVLDVSGYNDKIIFWSSDYHISPIRDLKHQLAPLGVRFIDKSLSGSCGSMGTCARNLYVLSAINGMNPSRAIRTQFFEYYKDDPLMNRVDAFVCFHPAAMCELFMPFNRTIVVIASTRYELGRFSATEWNEWNANLRTIAADPRNVVAGNNLYDAEYIRYFTGINTTVLPSMCDYTNAHYGSLSTRADFIYYPSYGSNQFSRAFLDELRRALGESEASVKPLRELYPRYDYSDLVRHPGIIHVPYQVSTMSIFEQYSMNIPLFFPSIDLLTSWHLQHGLIRDRTWERILTGNRQYRSKISPFDANTTVPDPNDEHHASSVRFWLQYADFYQWPFIVYFDSADDLAAKLIATNLTHVSEQMSAYNQQRRSRTLADWQVIVDGLSRSPNFLKKKNS